MQRLLASARALAANATEDVPTCRIIFQCFMQGLSDSREDSLSAAACWRDCAVKGVAMEILSRSWEGAPPITVSRLSKT
jgi:hypothetical protein